MIVCVQLEPSSWVPFLYLGHYYYQLPDLEKARKCYQVPYDHQMIGISRKSAKTLSVKLFTEFLPSIVIWDKIIMCRWFRFAQLAKGKKFRP
jgi:hypothetical protein